MSCLCVHNSLDIDLPSADRFDDAVEHGSRTKLGELVENDLFASLELICEFRDVPRAAEWIRDVGGTGLVRDDMLRAEGDAGRVSVGNATPR